MNNESNEKNRNLNTQKGEIIDFDQIQSNENKLNPLQDDSKTG